MIISYMDVSTESILPCLKPKVGQKIQMEGAQLILMNAAPKSAKVPQTGAPLIHLSGASIHLEVFGVDPALKDTQVSTLSFLPQIHKKTYFYFVNVKYIQVLPYLG